MKIDNIRKKTQGITFVALSIVIILLLILVGISFYVAKEEIEKERLEELKTDMLFIQAKAREYVEEVNTKMGIGSEEEKIERRDVARQEIYEEREKLEKADTIPEQLQIVMEDGEICYYLTKETKEKWELEKIENEEEYLIKVDEKNAKVEVYYIEGYEGKDSLTEIGQIQK